MQGRDIGCTDRTLYIVGLFGTGRRYINELMLQNIGERAKYFRDGIRLHSGPTPMIYSGHVTTKYPSRAQEVGSHEIHTGIGQIGLRGFDVRLSSSAGFIVDKLGLVADEHSRQPNDFGHLGSL